MNYDKPVVFASASEALDWLESAAGAERISLKTYQLAIDKIREYLDGKDAGREYTKWVP